MTEYRLSDPVVDLAQGRPMLVVDVPDQTVAEWSDANGYDLQGNYANSKFDPAADEGVVECVYVSDIRSEPSKTYTFPVSRVRLIDVHHADDGARIYDRVAVDVLRRLFATAFVSTFAINWPDNDTPFETHLDLLARRTFDGETADLARELADVDRRFDEADEP